MKGILFKPSIWIAKQKALDQYGLAVTRRIMKLNLGFGFELPHPTVSDERFKENLKMLGLTGRYHPGEVVYVKEAHYAYGHWTQFHESGKYHWEFFVDNPPIIHFADTEWVHALTKPSPKEGWYKRSPLFLEAEFARYFLEIVSVRPERLWEITEYDALKEGSTITGYPLLWDSINPKFPWARNHWVWRDEFKRVERPEVK